MHELTKITEPSQAIALYKITPKEIAERLKEYDNLRVIKGDTKSYKEVRGALTAIVKTRVEVDKRRKQLGEDARTTVSNYNQASKMLIEPMTPYEDRFRSELKVEDDRKAAIKAEKDRIEQERIDHIQGEITKISEIPLSTLNFTSDEVAALCDEMVIVEIIEEVYQEFTEKAKQAKLDAATALEDIYNDKVKQEKEAIERKAEAERLEKQRVEQAEAQAKIDKEKAAFEAEKKAEKEKQDRAEFKRKAKEEAKAKAERDAKEKTERQERKRIEAEKEVKRQEALKPDKEKIIGYADSLLEIPTPIVKSEDAKLIVGEMLGQLITLTENIKETAERM